MARRKFGEESDDVREVPLPAHVEEKLRAEAEALGLSLPEYMEKVAKGEITGIDPLMSRLFANLGASLDGKFWEQQMTRKEFFMEMLAFSTVFTHMGYLIMRPTLETMKNFGGSLSEGMKLGAGFYRELSQKVSEERRDTTTVELQKLKLQMFQAAMPIFQNLVQRLAGLPQPQEPKKRSFQDFVKEHAVAVDIKKEER
ncbi:hypothetical protein J7L60_01895 [Candidatus Bathyarchaeota archaeon]|nr:hypothetical protein [Candidatus Bathyarchaeota archaeon]